jgi:hypothetical protein
MRQMPECTLIEAIKAFDYPPITFDLLKSASVDFPA